MTATGLYDARHGNRSTALIYILTTTVLTTAAAHPVSYTQSGTRVTIYAITAALLNAPYTTVANDTGIQWGGKIPHTNRKFHVSDANRLSIAPRAASISAKYCAAGSNSLASEIRVILILRR